jgi:anti-sigma factor RsiW
MDCTLIQGHLIGYHFATVTDDERADVEAHLVACTECLRTYLALKAHVDRGTLDDEVPSEAARLRLRAAVEARFRPTPARRLGRVFTRPVPLYQGLAVAAVVLLAAALGPSIAHAVHPGPAAHAAERVDSARASAESLTIY